MSATQRPAAHPKLRALLDLWHAARGGSGLPPRTAFDPFALQPWLGNVSVFDEIAGERDFRLVLDGTNVVSLTGEDWTGRRSSEIDAAHGVRFTAELFAACEAGRPRVDLGHRLYAKRFLAVDRAILPVFHEGRGVRQVIVALYPADAD